MRRSAPRRHIRQGKICKDAQIGARKIAQAERSSQDFVLADEIALVPDHPLRVTGRP